MYLLRTTAVGVAVLFSSATTGLSGEPAAQPAAPATTTATLTCDGGAFSRFRLKNVKSRSYEPDSFSGQRCTLTKKAEGVIWVATGEGHALSDAGKKLSFKDDLGRQFGHTCWTRSGTINDVTQTEVILFGPQDSKVITVCCGQSCMNAQVQ